MSDNEGSCCAPQRPEEESRLTSLIATSSFKSPGGEFLTIPAGEFVMGTNDSFYPTDGENPSRSVWVDEFRIGKYATTNAEFAEFVNATGYVTEAQNYGWSYVFKGLVNEIRASTQLTGIASSAPWWLAIKNANWFNPFGNSLTIEELLDHPVAHITHNDALEFCNWAGYKLPTEAQWEKASRGGLEQALYPWGNDLLTHGQHNANIWQGDFPNLNSQEDGFFGTAPVNSFKPNGFGLYNLVGNVWEWTNDFWSSRWHIPESIETRKNPVGPQKASGNKVLKGGSFMCHDSYCYRYRNSARTFNSPNTSTSHIGFRCVI